jgi:hypothetical protein
MKNTIKMLYGIAQRNIFLVDCKLFGYKRWLTKLVIRVQTNFLANQTIREILYQ